MFLLKTCDREFVCPKAYPSCAFIPIPAKIPIKILSTLHSNFNIVKNLEFFLFCPFFVYSPRIAGIIHQEMPKGDSLGKMHGFQLWANLPASHKMMDPRYRDVKNENIPEVILENGTKIKIISGALGNQQGPVKDIVNEPIAWYGPIVMNTQDELRIAFEEYHNGTFIKHKRT